MLEKYKEDERYLRAVEVFANHKNEEDITFEKNIGENIVKLANSSRRNEYNYHKLIFEYYEEIQKRFPEISFAGIGLYLCNYTHLFGETSNRNYYDTFKNASKRLREEWKKNKIDKTKVRILGNIKCPDEQFLTYEKYRAQSSSNLNIIVKEVMKRKFSAAVENLKVNFPLLQKKEKLISTLVRLNGLSSKDPLEANFFNNKVFYEEDVMRLEEQVKSLDEKIVFYKEVLEIDNADVKGE